VIRTRMNRLLAAPVGKALDHLPSLERFVSDRTDRRRLPLALTRLRRRGLEIGVVYDIGAHRGDWTRAARESLPDARFFLFEANELHAGALEATGERYFTAVLSSEEKAVDFFLTGGSGDSYYREATERYAGVEPRTLKATTLDRLATLHTLPDPDLIKVDVQGAELDVLRGGRDVLGKAKLVLLECPVVDYNDGAPRMHEYLRFMDEAGFTVLDFLDCIWQGGRMIHVDVLFVRIGVDPLKAPRA
jgi:FkbM family methyltransferase